MLYFIHFPEQSLLHSDFAKKTKYKQYLDSGRRYYGSTPVNSMTVPTNAS